MKCRNPYVQGMHAYGCAQCMPCRVNRRRLWTHRIMLESMLYTDNAFVTLTYSEENLPEAGSLVPLHLTNFLKRFRKMIAPQRVRYYLVGEYGDESGRPHYHAALFGFKSCLYGRTRYSVYRLSCCVQCDLILEAWKSGNIYLGSLEDASAQYIAGYCLKKMTNPEDPRLNGRYPEFARMSLRPGIAGDAMQSVADSILRYNCLEDDVPAALRHGRALHPLGRYLRRRLRVLVKRDVLAPKEVQLERSKEMHPLYAANVLDPSYSVKSQLIDVDSEVVRQLEARRKIFKGRKVL